VTAKPTTPAALTWSGVTARRMARHALTGPATGLGPAGIASVLCGAHAQVLSAAELSIGRPVGTRNGGPDLGRGGLPGLAWPFSVRGPGQAG